MSDKPGRDVERVYTNQEFVAKLRRLADAIEKGERFEIQVAGERIYVPVSAVFSVEHERSEEDEEIEFQVKWTLAAK
ncbi:amphi-Trp domain-containing protein [Hydrogenophaga sp.]|uniref:amphi-Trp domain-containing protein n=1 Tax=Hydrogenophaga sp. TaxID=1904254 RepID=UPI003F726184